MVCKLHEFLGGESLSVCHPVHQTLETVGKRLVSNFDGYYSHLSNSERKRIRRQIRLKSIGLMLVDQHTFVKLGVRVFDA